MKQLLFLSALLLSIASHSQKVEAESGVLSGTVVQTSRQGYSGTGYVTGFDSDRDAVTMTVAVADEGLYDLWVGYAAPSGEKTNDIYVNGVFSGNQIYAQTETFKESVFGKVNLKEGSNEIKIVKNWGYFDVDYVRVAPTVPNETNNFSESLINLEATANANILYRYLRDLYGHRILSGQQAGDGGNVEFDYLQKHTGKLPAVKGFDLIDYSPSRVERGTTSQQTMQSIDWWERGGIVSMMWHWNAPKDLLDTPDARWWSGFYTYATTFDLSIAMNDQHSEEYQLILRDMDAIAAQLKLLADADVPILWRPLHEAEGGWFWWGSKGPESCVWLWKLLYDRLTNHHGFNNLIWIWTGTNSEAALNWYPGDEYVDIVGADIYLNDGNYSASFSLFDDLAGLHGGTKIITMSETGTIPNADALKSEKAAWSWFCTWSGEFITDGVKNGVSHLNAVYNHDYVITFDELPDFANYVSPVFEEIEEENEEEEEMLLAALPSASWSYYPNPTQNSLVLKTDFFESIHEIQVYNLEGNRVNTMSGLAMQSETLIDLSDEPKGIYMIRLVTDFGLLHHRVGKF